MTSPMLWYVNRGTGVVLLVVFTLTTVLGVLAMGRSTSVWWPRFVTQGLHRTLSALSVLLLLGHASVAVVDEFVDIRWWQVVVPFGGTYQPLWLGLGAVSLDLTALVVATSLARRWVAHRVWFRVHLTAYLAWLLGAVHGIGIGTDTSRSWLAVTNVACLGLVAVVVTARGVAVARGLRARRLRSGGGHADEPGAGAWPWPQGETS